LAIAFFINKTMKNKKLFILLLDLGLVIAAGAAGPLSRWMIAFFPDCPIASMGFLCPSCGGTRCVRAFFSGDFVAALSLNPFFFVLIWYLGVALMLLNVGVLMRVEWAEKAARLMTGWQAVVIAAVIFVIFGVVRNFV
jgi:hypothetical protein